MASVTFRDLSGAQTVMVLEPTRTLSSIRETLRAIDRFKDRENFDLVYDGRVLTEGTCESERMTDGAVVHILPKTSTKTPTTSPGTTPLKESPDSYKLTGISKVDYNKSVFEHLANRWDIRGFRGGDLRVDGAGLGEAVLIQDCMDTIVRVPVKKVNRILLDRCTRVKLYFNSVISKLEIVNGVDVEIEIGGTAPTVQIDLSRDIKINVTSDTPGLTDMRFVHASCSDVVVHVTDQHLKMQIPTSLLQDQMASRVSLSAGRFVLKSLGTERLKKGGYLNLSLLDSTDGIPIPTSRRTREL